MSWYYIELWGSKIWAHDLGPGTTFHQQYARGEHNTSYISKLVNHLIKVNTTQLMYYFIFLPILFIYKKIDVIS